MVDKQINIYNMMLDFKHALAMINGHHKAITWKFLQHSNNFDQIPTFSSSSFRYFVLDISPINLNNSPS